MREPHSGHCNLVGVQCSVMLNANFEILRCLFRTQFSVYAVLAEAGWNRFSGRFGEYLGRPSAELNDFASIQLQNKYNFVQDFLLCSETEWW